MKPVTNRDLALDSRTSSSTCGCSAEFDNFVYLLSHDIRSSARAILELPTWIKEDLIEDGHEIVGGLAENFALLKTHTKRLDQMLTDLLVFSRIGRSQSISKTKLRDAVATALKQVDPPKEFNVLLELDDSSLTMGSQDIVTLFTALVSNAVKHHHLDHGTLRLACWKEDGEHVITIGDDGPGIPEKHAARVFEAMTTLKSRDEVEGSGMGLAIVQKIVNTNHGSIRWLPATSQYATILEIRFGEAV